MSNWFILAIYLLFCYGCSEIVTSGIGPKNIFFRFREWSENVGPNFAMLFKCMLCFPTNLGIVTSLLNWFLLPDLAVTPFNMMFTEEYHVWYISLVAAIMDGCIVGAVCHFLWNLEDFIDKSTPYFEEHPEKWSDEDEEK